MENHSYLIRGKLFSGKKQCKMSEHTWANLTFVTIGEFLFEIANILCWTTTCSINGKMKYGKVKKMDCSLFFVYQNFCLLRRLLRACTSDVVYGFDCRYDRYSDTIAGGLAKASSWIFSGPKL